MQLTHYEEKQNGYQQKINNLTTTCNHISSLRVFTFIIFSILLYQGYTQKSPVYTILAGTALLVFVLFVRHHNKLDAQKQYLADCQAVTGDYIARFGDGWKQFPADGTRYLSEAFPEGSDLDIFGRHSLYQYLCTASTVFGQKQLADWLREHTKNPALLKARQQAVRELAEKPAFTLEFEAAARSLRKQTYEDANAAIHALFASLRQNSRFGAVRRAAIRLFPALTTAFLLLAVSGYRRQLTASCFLLSASLQLMAAFIGFYWNNRLLAPVYRLNRTITPYRKLFTLLEQETFHSPLLGTLQKELLHKTSASAALKKLEVIADSVMARHNLLALVLCNCLYLHDFHCAEKYADWKARYQNELKTWLDIIGTVEALISLGVIFHTKETCTMPQIIDGPETKLRPVFSAADIRHPLLKESSAIGNDVKLEHRTCIITGSNMSGKTTFMRSIGINLILAYAGGFCTAASMRVSLMEIRTSMRVQDNVNEGVSTFYAELLRIRNMIETSQKQLPMISFIDEIYKGTNAKDRIFAARETVKKLSQPYAFTLLSTHDFELCDLEKDPGIDAENYYFTEHYEHNQILFDYKIRKGRCTTTNARYLLQMAGIV